MAEKSKNHPLLQKNTTKQLSQLLSKQHPVFVYAILGWCVFKLKIKTGPRVLVKISLSKVVRLQSK